MIRGVGAAQAEPGPPRPTAATAAVGFLLMVSAVTAVSAQETPTRSYEAEASSLATETVTLGQALRRAANVDPDYVAALGRIDNAGWGRRAAWMAFIIPSINASASGQRFSSQFFNIGTAQLTSQLVQGSVTATLNLFSGDKFWELDRAQSEQVAADANELQQLYQTALDTEADYYQVLAGRELVAVQEERVRRASEQLGIARARVVSGAAVQTDSLQLLLELTRARVELLRQTAELRVARFQLGRRIGAAGPADAAAVDTSAAPMLPISEADAIVEAVRTSPEIRVADADAETAEAALWGERADYLPSIDLFAQASAFDEAFFPSQTTRGIIGLQLTWPIWNGAQREIQISRARVDRDVASARRNDAERELRRDVVQAYQAYNTARATADLAADAVIVARENLRVQESRYRAGATTILDLIVAQVDLTDAESGLVQARYSTWLGLAGLEAILGRRLFPDRIEP